MVANNFIGGSKAGAVGVVQDRYVESTEVLSTYPTRLPDNTIGHRLYNSPWCTYGGRRSTQVYLRKLACEHLCVGYPRRNG
jgi:hypothetical protein